MSLVIDRKRLTAILRKPESQGEVATLSLEMEEHGAGAGGPHNQSATRL